MLKIKIFFIITLAIFISSCIGVKEVIKYKTYTFNEYIQLQSLKFKPFISDDSFKAKIKLTLASGKSYSFYGMIYLDRSGNIYRIFTYSLFGKNIIDIFFDKDKNYVTLEKEEILYVVETDNKVDSEKSLFYFLKNILAGIKVENAIIENSCVSGYFQDFYVKSCEIDNYKKIFFYKNSQLEKYFEFPDDKEMIFEIGSEKLEIELKDKIENKDFVSNFLNYTKNFKIVKQESLKELEDRILK